MTRPLRLVILDEDSEATKRLSAALSADGVVVYCVSDPDEACRLIALLRHDLLLIDIEKLIRTPVYPLQTFRQTNSDLKIVGISRGRRGDTGLLLELLGLGAYVREPVTPESLIISLPEIADRYLMASPGATPGGDHNGQHRQERPSDSMSFSGNGRSHS